MSEVRAAMILGAGLGTRLRPLTDWLAKPMVPIGDAPAVAHVTRRVRLVTDRIVVNVHHRPDDLAAWASAEHVAVSEEVTLLGTAGGVARAASLLGEGDVLIWNGDIVSAFDPRELVAAHAAHASRAQATLVVRSRPAGEGNVGVDAQGRVVRLRQERFGVGVAGEREATGGEFLGIHVLGAELRALLPAEGCLVGDVYLPALRRGASLRAHATTASFVDVGTVASYLEANRAWLAEQGLASWSSPDADVHGSIEGSVVGAGARVDASVTRSVVWPGAVVREPLTDAVAAPLGVVTAPQSR